MARKQMGGLAKAARRKLRKRAGLVETRRKKEFTYRGYTLDEMKAMTLEEIIELLPARPRRSFMRGIDEERFTFVEKVRANGTDEAVRTHCRDVPILPDFVGKKVAVHNGKEFVTVEIRAEMIGHYIGEFAMTRKPVTHSRPGVGATRSSKFTTLKGGVDCRSSGTRSNRRSRRWPEPTVGSCRSHGRSPWNSPASSEGRRSTRRASTSRK